MKFGIVADIHKSPDKIILAIKKFKEEKVDAIIVNGDIGELMPNFNDSLAFTASILRPLGKSEIPTIIQPGSSETIGAFGEVLKSATKKYENLHSALDKRIYDFDGLKLIFIPGSDITDTGEYQITANTKTGYYTNNKNGRQKPRHLENINDIKSYDINPEKTIVVCHVPRRFETEDAVDIAEYGIKRGRGICPAWAVHRDIYQKYGELPEDKIIEIADIEMDIELKKDNRGNEDLKALFEKLKITKAISNHFHESGHKGCDNDGKKVDESTFVESLFYNSGSLDDNRCGIITTKGDKISYKNININSQSS